MANEFKIKNGYLSEGNSQITGSLNVSAGITGSLFGTSSYAIQALSASYVQTVQTSSYALSASYAISSSFSQTSQTASYVENAVSASYAAQALSASYATQAGNASTIDINVFGSPVESYLLMSNVAGTTGVAIGGDADLRYNASTNVLTVGNVSATTLTGSLLGTSSYALQALSSSYSVTASYYGGSVTSASYAVSASYAQTASYLNTLNQDLTFNGNLTLNGTASIAYLNVSYESASVIYSSGSNQFGDAANDTQTLYGSVIIPTGSLTVSGALAVNSSQNSYFVGGGNVGIGTLTPSVVLDVHKSLDSSYIRINSSGNYETGYQIYNSGAIKWQMYVPNSSNDLRFYDGFDNRVTFQYGGNVGIGTLTPAYKLSVVGKIALNDGGNSLFIGDNAGQLDDATDNRNIAIGTNSSQNNVSGSQNVAVGHNTLVNNTNINNTAVGANALQFNTTALNNTAFGSFALNTNTVGSSSIAVGAAALLFNTIGNHNTAVGNSAIRSNVSGSNNVGVGGSVMFNNTNGSDNVALGWNSARYFGTGTSSLTDTSGSIFIGTLARANASGEVNQIVIGMNALGLGSNSVVLGNDNITKTVLKGNVGIGTTSPSSKLHLQGTTTLLTITDTTYSRTSQIGYVDSANLYFANDGSSNTYIGAYNNVFLAYGGGNVGIGTTSPQGRLAVDGGNIRFNYGNAAAAYYLYLNHNSSQDGGILWTRDNSTFDWQINNDGGNGDLYFYSYGTSTQAITFKKATGNVGIGATSPSSKLEVAGALGGTVGVGGSTLKLTNTDTGNYASITAGITGVTNSGMQFSTDGTTRMIIASSGNVSIGTTAAPGNRLITSQDATYNNENTYGIAAAASTNNDYKTIIGYDYSNDIGVISAVRAAVGWKNLSLAPVAGNVGIGTMSPAAKLDVSVAQDTSGYSLSGYPFLKYSAGDVLDFGAFGSTWSALRFLTANTERIRITSTGNVGIGTASPSYLLDVNGTARVTTLIETSAAKYKTNIQPLEPQLSKVTQLEPVTFDWLDKPQTKTNIGLIADEVEKIYPEFVSKTEDGEIEGIEYSKLTTVLIQSIKELKAIVDKQQEQINTLLNK